MAARRTLHLLVLTATLAIPARAAEDPPRDATQDPWRSADAPAAAPGKSGRAPHRPKRVRSLTLDQGALAAVMAGAPREHGRAARERPLVVSLPAPDGGFQRFAVHESPVMEPGLAARHPEIQTYSGQGVDSPASTIRLDLSPLGFHASVRGPQGMWYIDPTSPLDASLYQSYFRRDVVDNPHGPLVEREAETAEISTDRGYYHAPDTVSLRGAGFAPLASIVVTITTEEGSARTVDAVADASGTFNASFVADPDQSLGTRLVDATDGTSAASSAYDVVTAEDTSVDPPVGDQLRTYRLALLTDPSYAAYFGAANVTAAKVALVNRITHVYESETAIRLVLIDDNDVLNLDTDAQMTGANGPCGGAACFTPTQATSCAGGTLTRIRQVIGLLVGASKYDIGHMALGLNAGGMASLAVVGGNNKAMGCTGLANPVGDAFAVDYVAHEMGHQFSGNHTFNGTSGSCISANRNASTSVEPGSGSSIMGRAGMCQTDDLQAHSDPYWSPRSFDEITNFVAAAETSTNDVQMAALTGFDGTDSFQLRFNGKDSAPVVRGRNFTTAGIQAALQGIAGWPAFGTASITLLTDTSFTITLGGSLALTDVAPIALVNCSGCTGYIGEVAKGGPTTHRGVATPTGNAFPVVTVPAQFTLPLRTPFALTGSATDADGDTLTYTWEQNDRGGPTGTALMSDLKTNGPLFRQFGSAAVVSASDALQYDPRGENTAGLEPTRVFPGLEQILANGTNAETGTCPAGDVDCFSEFLPTAAYMGTAGVNGSPPSLHFRLTARDGRADGGGVNTATTTLVLAANAGPFLVTAPNAAVTYAGGSVQTVTWDVANTNLPPVQTTDVRIRLSIDGGHTYPYDLAASTPNDGAQTVVLPNVGTTRARVKVEAIGNVFFDVSNRDFVIQAVPVITSGGPGGAAVQYSDSLSSAVTVSAGDADSAGSALVVSVTGLPAGLSLVTVSVSDDATRPGTATWAVVGKVAATPGTYDVRVTVTDEADDTDSTSFPITVRAEDAEATYTGDALAFTSPGATTATVVLRATVRDGSVVPSLADNEPGDITNATVTFKENGSALCEPFPPTLLDGTASGSVSCSVTLWPGTHAIDVEVDGRYTGTSRSEVEVLTPEGSFVAGAGRLVLDASGGRYEATAGSKAEFALGLKYKPKSPRDPKGHIEVVFKAGSQTYAIRSSDIDLLGVSEEAPSGKGCHGRGATCLGRADMRWTATLTDVTDAWRPISIGSNLALQVTVTDRGDRHGSGDSIAVTLWDGDTLLFSSRWTGSRTLEQFLETGKITVD